MLQPEEKKLDHKDNEIQNHGAASRYAVVARQAWVHVTLSGYRDKGCDIRQLHFFFAHGDTGLSTIYSASQLYTAGVDARSKGIPFQYSNPAQHIYFYIPQSMHFG